LTFRKSTQNLVELSFSLPALLGLTMGHRMVCMNLM
jgi:hypothetical protein